jgi:cobalt-precorrin 5A hydrolase
MRVAVGLGCDRGASLTTVQAAVEEALACIDLGLAAVSVVATIDAKRDELAILALAERHGWPLRFYDAAELAAVAVPSPSDTLLRRMGTPGVAEPAALLAAATDPSGLLLAKRKYRGADGKNTTVAIARLGRGG